MNKEVSENEIRNSDITGDTDDLFAATIKEAERFTAMADKILLARFKEKYYLEALKILEKIAEEGIGPLTEEQNREKENLTRAVTVKLNEARARSVIEKYDFACKSKEYAKTSEDLGSAEMHFKEAEEARKKEKVDAEILSPECRRLYEETAKASEMQKECSSRAGRTYRKGRVKLLLGILVAAAVCTGFLLGRHTVTYRTMMGHLELAIGLNDNAVKNFERAYNRHQSDETWQAYIKALKHAGMDAVKKQDLETATDYLHLPALEGDEEAAREVTKAEIQLASLAAVGDQIEFAGTDWLVLDREEDKLLLVRYEGLPSMAYQSDREEKTDWEGSDVREYLNGDYLEENFNVEEMAYLVETQVKAEDNPVYGTDAGNDTMDLVYILSNEEYRGYADLINAAGHNCWLRTPGAEEGTESFVDVEKNIMDFGYDASSDSMCLKPVLWILAEENIN